MLAGRVPANVTAIVMKTADGEDEMSCQTGTALFDTPEGKIKRGVISFYAAKTLHEATTVESWLGLINKAMGDDVKNGLLRYERLMQVLGNGKTQLPKEINPIAVRSETTSKP